MTQSTDSDFDYARRLFKELNGVDVVCIDDNQNEIQPGNGNQRNNISIIELSDDEDELPQTSKAARIPQTSRAARNRSRSLLKKIENEVTFENQQAIKVRRKF